MRVKKKRDTLEQSYLLYLDGTPNPVSLKLYKQICYSFNREVARLIIEEGIEYKLPCKLGSIGIKRRKMKFHKPKFDYGHWNKYKEISFHLNEHSKEWYGFCHWSKKNCRVKGKKVYQFVLSRDNKRRVAKEFQIEDNYQKYQEAPESIKRNAEKRNKLKEKLNKDSNGI